MTRRTIDDILARCDAWEESKHPRNPDGEFSSGSGGKSGGAAEPVSLKQTSPAPFVHDLFKRFQNPAKMREYLATVPNEKLHTALRLIGQTKDLSDASQHVKKLIEKELDERANRGA